MPVQHVGGDVRPKLAEDIRQGITPNGVSVFHPERSNGAVSARIVG